MALLNLFRRLKFFEGRNTNGMKDEDLDFSAWVKVHMDWRTRLVAYIHGTSREALNEHVICLDDYCDLGRWIHSHGQRYYGDVPSFNELRSRHADFHATAGRVVSVFKSAGPLAAQKALNEEFDLSSIRVVRCLENLERHVKA